MRAAVLRQYGPPEAVELADVPDPDVRRGQVLIRVRAASLNPLDFKLRQGMLRPFLRLSFPAVLGFDFAGEIVRPGDAVAGWRPGERVYGRIDSRTGGTHAELAAVGADVIDRIPQRLSMEEAASLPLTGMTAVQALREARLEAGDYLLVNGASGGVGSIAVQVGRARGANVTGVCRGESAELVRRLGASKLLDYTRGEVDRAVDRFDVILDTVANRPWNVFARLIDDGGKYVTTGFSVGLAVQAVWQRLRRGPRIRFVVSRADGALMRELSSLVEDEKVDSVVDSVFPLGRIVDAYRHLEEDHVQGKVVITIP